MEKAGSRKITTQTVKAAVKELRPAGTAKPVGRQPRQNQAQQRKRIDGAIGEFLVLLSQKASHKVLTREYQTLGTQII